MNTTMQNYPEYELQVVFLDGIRKGEVEHFTSGVISFGRSQDCNIVFHRASLTVSRVHAKIILKDNAFFLENSSANGSFVNGVRQQHIRLNSGDVIAFSENGPKVRVIFRDFQQIPGQQNFPQISLQYENNNQSFVQDYVIVGNSPDCDFEIVHPLVSPQHAVLYFSNNELFIGHASDADQIIINGRHIQEKTKLRTNDIIELHIDGPRLKYLGSGKLIQQHDHPDTTLSPRGNEEMRTYIIPSPKPSVLHSLKSSLNKKKTKSS